MHLSFDPKKIKTKELHQYLLSTVAPRPIAFVSTVNEQGVANLAPYSFFNCFSSNPPILIFSSNRRVRDNTTKHTLHNVEQHKEVVVNIVNYPILRQMALTSVEFPEGISEFDKSGLTAVPSDLVKPPRVKESIANFECVVKDIQSLGDHGGAGNLVICEVVKLHLAEHIFDEEGNIDPEKTDLVARMGRAFYCRANGNNVFPVIQPVNVIPIGWDKIPEQIRKSEVLTGNELGTLAGYEAFPANEDVESFRTDQRIVRLKESCKNNKEMLRRQQHQLASEMIAQGKVDAAWKTLLLDLVKDIEEEN